MTRYNYRTLLILMLCGLIASCSGQSASNGSAKVTISIDSGRTAAPAPGIAKAAPRVESLTFTVSAPDIPTITSSMTITSRGAVTATFTVPNGNSRVFSVVLFDAAGEAAYAGSTVADLSGTPVSLTIAVTPLFFTGTRLAGTAADDYGNAIARDADGNIFVAGLTYGDFSNPLAASPAGAVGDAFFTKFDVSGAPLWTRQFGASASSIANGIAVDANGNIFVVGASGGDLFGETNHGHADCFVVKFNSAGSVLWTRLIGGAGDDMGNAVVTDTAGNIFVTGFMDSLDPASQGKGLYDVFVVKLDSAGAQQWLQQYGSPDTDAGEAVALDAVGNIFVAGYTLGVFSQNTNAGSSDFFVSKINPAGTSITTVQRGSNDSDQARSIAVDSSTVSVAGNTYGSLGGQANLDPNGTSTDIFIARFDLNLVEQATWLNGTSGNDTVQGIAADAEGNLFVVGSTNGAFPGSTNSGGYDSLVIKYQSTGTVAWARQIGTPSDDDGNAVVLDKKGNPILTGSEKGDFDGIANSGFGIDAFLMSYDTSGVKQ